MKEGEQAMGESAKMIGPEKPDRSRDESRLLIRIALKDTDALAALYRMWGDRLYSMALHWVKDEGAAREVLQDCMLRVWKKAPDFESEKSSAFTWCAMILRGLCLDHLRKRRRRAAVWQDWETSSMLEMTARCGVEDLIFRETITSVRAALARLDESEAESVRVALFDPGTVQDHASRWGIPLGTAKIRIHRAMLKLREILNQGGQNESY